MRRVVLPLLAAAFGPVPAPVDVPLFVFVDVDVLIAFAILQAVVVQDQLV